jgi:hypothetical protein
MSTLIKNNFKLLEAIMIDGTFPVMAMVLGVVEKREYSKMLHLGTLAAKNRHF